MARALSKRKVISEENIQDVSDDSKIDVVLEDSIAKTCLLILTSLVNQNMKVVSEDENIERIINDFNRKIKITRKMDSIVYNQLARGWSVLQHDVSKPKIKVIDSSTFTLVYNPIEDEFEGIYQDVYYNDPEALKEGLEIKELYQKYIPADDNLVLITGMGKGNGESLLLQAYPYVAAKKELVDSLPELVKRLGLLIVIGVDLPGDIGDSQLDTYLDDIEDIVRRSRSNATWILPKDTDVNGVTGSGEARIIESVKIVIEMLDEEIRKCLFVPDTFLTSLSANRATAKEQRYLISSMVLHIRDLIEEGMIDVYDKLLLVEGINSTEYEFSWGNINLPEPEKLFDFFLQAHDKNIVKTNEVRANVNLGSVKEGEIKNQPSQNIYQMMGTGFPNRGDNSGNRRSSNFPQQENERR